MQKTVSRYIIGIDLGTSNCALSYIDTYIGSTVKILPIRQQVSATLANEEKLLPSFILIADGKESIGAYAKDMVRLLPERVIHSAKSWLSVKELESDEILLPFRTTALSDAEKLTPLVASSRYLQYLKEAWDESFPFFNEQDITVTVPASFDEVAQRRTLEACTLAGYNVNNVKLLEEPQAAFYNFIATNEVALRALTLRPANLVVLDVGGGTTDISLFKLDSDDELERIAVADHTLLGGDNMDLALAHFIEEKSGEKLSRIRFNVLLSLARNLKEEILNDSNGSDIRHFALPPDEGSDIFATTKSVPLNVTEMQNLLLEGFFPTVYKDEVLRSDKDKSPGLREVGLRYCSESGITRILRLFLKEQCNDQKIDAIFFTGGALKPTIFRQRILASLQLWQEEVPIELPNPSFDHAVSLGAAHFGLAYRESATYKRIKSGYPSSVYLEIESINGEVHLICIVNWGARSGLDVTLPDARFRARIGEAVSFNLLTARNRHEDQIGDIIFPHDNYEGFVRLPSLVTKLDHVSGGITHMEVNLRVQLTETGLLKLSCLGREVKREWLLNFNLRKNRQAITSKGKLPSEALNEGRDIIEKYFGAKLKTATLLRPKKLISELEIALGAKRDEWQVDTLRYLWSALVNGVTKRTRSSEHEQVFFILSGFILRPGFGYELDDLRINELWRTFSKGVLFPKERENILQWWIMWRRVAGGLDHRRQSELFLSFRGEVLNEPEVLRLFGSLERLSVANKIIVGDELVTKIKRVKALSNSHEAWALERLSTRSLSYASKQYVVPGSEVMRWFHQLAPLDWRHKNLAELNTSFLSGTLNVKDRDIDLKEEEKAQILKKLRASGASLVLQSKLSKAFSLQSALGEKIALPLGLKLVE
jgi:hypothetical protein